MFRDANEELKRLEEELLAQEEETDEETEGEERDEDYEEEYEEYQEYEEYEEEPDEEYEMPPQTKPVRAYNADKLDVALEEFSEEVQKDRRYNWLAWVVVLATAAFVVMLYLYLKQGGYLP